MAQVNTYVNLSASGSVLGGTGVLFGMYVNSTASGTVKLYDNTTNSGTVIFNTITPAIGFHNLGSVNASVGVYADYGALGVGALDITFMVKTSD